MGKVYVWAMVSTLMVSESVHKKTQQKAGFLNSK